MSTLPELSQNFVPLRWEQIPNWQHDDHLAAFMCFLQSARRIVQKSYSTKLLGIPAESFTQIARAATSKSIADNMAARKFFENHFTPHAFNNTHKAKFLTGYYEPRIRASTAPTQQFKFPLYRRPEDLIDLNDDNRPSDIDQSFMFGRKTNTTITHYFNRQQIQNGALEGRGLELFWLENPVDVFFIHIQGSAHLTLEDGKQVRVSYAAKSGHPYTPIGKVLVENGELKLADVTMDLIRSWLERHRDKQLDIMAKNNSYIFFQSTHQPDPDLGPVAAAGVALTAGRSLAIDHKLHTFGTPVWVQTQENFVDSKTPLSRLLISQDTGSAIVGAQRGDLFVGSGEKAGQLAGKIKHRVSMTVLVPNNAGAQ